MATEAERRTGPVRLEEIIDLFPKQEAIEVSDRGTVYNLYAPRGVELRDYLDDYHLPAITKFSTLVVSEAFSPLRRAVTDWDQVRLRKQADARVLERISDIARQQPDGRHPDALLATGLRNEYLTLMVGTMRRMISKNPIGIHDVVVPIERCGGNIARALPELHSGPSVSLDAKRLRFRGNEGLLGVGINLEIWMAWWLEDKRVRLIEGVVASGSTEVAVMAALSNLNVNYRGLDCDAIVVCPQGRAFVADFRRAIGVVGEERGAYTAGVLDRNWYLRYHAEDPIKEEFTDAASFIGAQVLGDAGDYTTVNL
jgi:hypothetical protein